MEEPLCLCSGLLSIQRVSKKHRLSKSGSVLPGKRVGRNALLPVRARWDSPGMESGPLLCSCQAFPGPGPVLGMVLASSQYSSGGKMLSSKAGKELLQLLTQVSTGILPGAAAVVGGSHLIAFPAHVFISLAAGMGRRREAKVQNCAALRWGWFALPGCSGLEINTGMSPRQTASRAMPQELCSHTAAGPRSPGAAGGSPH